MAYSKEQKQRAFLIYQQCRTLNGTAKLAGVKHATISRWAKEEGWAEKLEASKEMAACNPFDDDRALEGYIEQFNIPKEDSDVLRQIKIVENICFACMRDEIPTEQIRLQPNTFKEATDILVKCWTARQSLLHSKTGSTNITGQNVKVDFITQAE
jgi:hypothetical protein